MSNTFGQPMAGQRELEGGGFYATPSTTCEAGKIAVFGTFGLFGIPDVVVPAGERGWFSNGSLGDTRIFEKPSTWISTTGGLVFWNGTDFTDSSTDPFEGSAILIGWQVDAKATPSGKIKVALSHLPFYAGIEGLKSASIVPSKMPEGVVIIE